MILLLSLLKMLIIAVLFITEAINLLKNSVLNDHEDI